MIPRKFVTGANWSAAIGNPFRRFGSTGEGLESTLAKVRANANQRRSSARFTWPRRASNSPTAARVRSSSLTTRSSPMTKPRPRNIANDILDCGRDRDREMDAAEEIRGAASRQYPLSRVAHDEESRARPRKRRRGA